MKVLTNSTAGPRKEKRIPRQEARLNRYRRAPTIATGMDMRNSSEMPSAEPVKRCLSHAQTDVRVEELLEPAGGHQRAMTRPPLFVLGRRLKGRPADRHDGPHALRMMRGRPQRQRGPHRRPAPHGGRDPEAVEPADDIAALLRIRVVLRPLE